jgi:hypothetical protein
MISSNSTWRRNLACTSECQDDHYVYIKYQLYSSVTTTHRIVMKKQSFSLIQQHEIHHIYSPYITFVSTTGLGHIRCVHAVTRWYPGRNVEVFSGLIHYKINEDIRTCNRLEYESRGVQDGKVDDRSYSLSICCKDPMCGIHGDDW